MIRINLLPHRQIRRAERQRQFNLMLVATVVAGAGIVFMGWTYINAKIDAQKSRNTRLDAAIVQLDHEIRDINKLKEQIRNVLDRKRVVENLQSDRSQAVVLLDELARQLPEGVFLKSIKQQDNEIVLEGIADTNARVATLVRNLGNSEWLESPVLIEIKSVTSKNLRQSAFTLKVNQKVKKPAMVENVKNRGRSG
ncbi:fimbrial assembly protein PilN [mine drainage metagenome]|uniref:Fimbrial assembly protein PilN n=1 Tax=mine drainage metagenome TaxID=410659 RepID=A0A1J5QHQ9_9ZZZZ